MDDKDEHDARGRSCSEAGETRAAFGKSAQAHSVETSAFCPPVFNSSICIGHLYSRIPIGFTAGICLNPS